MPHWEHGYRAHGYWSGTRRIGVVYLGPPGLWDRIYRCYLDGSEVTWEYKTLRSAKHRIEVECRKVAGHLDDEGCMKLLVAVVLQWWREAEKLGDADALADFLGVPDEQVRGVRPLRIDSWRRKRYVADGGKEGESDVYF